MVGPWFSPPGPVIIVFKIVKNRHNPGSPNFKNLQKLFIALPVFGSKSALEIRLKHQAAEVIAEVKPMVPGAHVPMAHVSTAMPRPHVHRVAYVAIGHVAAQPGKAWKTQHNSTTCWLLLVSTPHELHMYIRVYTYKHTCVVHVYIYIHIHTPFTFHLHTHAPYSREINYKTA
jgi:hypothetical protein